jgi:8-oxo-dGTP pyrophosphatase MutT (NUDIX family)
VLDSYDLDTVVAALGGHLAAASVRQAEDVGPRPRAAVAAILRRGPGDAELLFMRRAEREGDPWSGHASFPGGRRSASDASLVDTAVRETLEEVGIDLARDARLLARLPDVPAIARSKRVDLTITPFVFALEREVTIVPNHEVAGVVWAPLGPVARDESAGTLDYVHEVRAQRLSTSKVGDLVVWGLTHMMLQLFFQALDA